MGDVSSVGHRRFSEEQRFRQPWLLFITAFPVVVAWLAFVQQIVRGEPFGSRPASDAAVVGLFVVGGLGLPAVVWLVRLRTTVDDRALMVRFPPFRPRQVDLATVDDVRVVTYRAMAQWGGYGYRRKLSGDVAFLVHGERGVEISTGGSKALLIGSQRPDELAAALAQPPSASSPGSSP